MLTNRLKNESGYSLVEVMVAIMLLSIAIIPMVSMFDMGLKTATQGSNYDKARALANSKLEEIKTQDYQQVRSSYPPANGPSPPSGGSVACSVPVESGFGCQIQTNYVSLGISGITADANARTMMQVKVTVTWGSGNQYSTTGLVSK